MTLVYERNPKSPAGSFAACLALSAAAWALLETGAVTLTSRTAFLFAWSCLLYLGPESDHRGLNVVACQRICMSLSCSHYSLGFYLKVLCILY